MIKGNQAGRNSCLSGSLITYLCGEAAVNRKSKIPNLKYGLINFDIELVSNHGLSVFSYIIDRTSPPNKKNDVPVG